MKLSALKKILTCIKNENASNDERFIPTTAKIKEEKNFISLCWKTKTGESELYFNSDGKCIGGGED